MKTKRIVFKLFMAVLFVAFGDLKYGDMIKLKPFVLFLHNLSVISVGSAQYTVSVVEEFSNVKIPLKLVTSYYRTSSSCPRRAIVFKTKAGKEFCIDPETTWVSGHVAKVDKRTKTATETNFTTTTATESNARSTTNATKTTATESTSAASTTATTAKTQSLPV
uniref:Chemokine interleukin-8-like domain-containing protein n=1 Tax=Cyprinus carpio carpio TaxID=630221 RepID=A0A9J8C4X2_CYPCA